MTKRTSDLKRAKNFLAIEYPHAFTPDKVKEYLNLGCSSSTLARKFRAASKGVLPELVRSYYRNEQGEDIAIYGANPDYLAQMAEERRVEAAENARESAQESAGLDSLGRGPK